MTKKSGDQKLKTIRHVIKLNERSIASIEFIQSMANYTTIKQNYIEITDDENDIADFRDLPNSYIHSRIIVSYYHYLILLIIQ